MRHVKILIAVLMLCLIAGCTQKAMMTPEINVDTLYAGMSEQDVEKAVIDACLAKGWKIDAREDGQIDASLRIRTKHLIAVRIPYSAHSVRIEYRDSENMRYKAGSKPTIHRNYNNSVDYLVRDIHARLTAISNSRIAK